MEMQERVRYFIGRYARNSEFKNDDDIFASGYVNSLFAMQLVLYIEKEFAIKIDNKDLDIKNFRTVNTIADFIDNKLNVEVRQAS